MPVRYIDADLDLQRNFLLKAVVEQDVTANIDSVLTTIGQLGYDTTLTRLKTNDGSVVRYLLQDNDIDTDPGLVANSDALVPSQAAVVAFVNSKVTGLLEYKGTIDASVNPNYPAGVVGDFYVFDAAGKIGGAAGEDVSAGDVMVCNSDNAGGDQPTAGAFWDTINKNIDEALLAGEANLGANVGTGVGVFDGKTGVTLDFRGIAAASSKVTTTLNVGNKDVDIDIVPGNINADELGVGALTASEILRVNAGGTAIESAGITAANIFNKSVDDTDDITEGVTNLFFTNERVDDRVAALIQNGTGLTWTYDDGLNTLTGNVSLSPFSTTDLSEGVNLYYTDERVDDRVAALMTDTTSIAWTYTDISNTLEANVQADTTTQRIEVTKNSGAVVGTRKTLNFIEGSNITLTIADDGPGNEVDITIASSGASFGSDNQIPYTNAGGTDFDYSANFTYDGSALSLTGTDAVFTTTLVDIQNSAAASVLNIRNNGSVSFGGAGFAGTRLHVKAFGTGTNYAFYVQDSANTDRVIIREDGRVSLTSAYAGAASHATVTQFTSSLSASGTSSQADIGIGFSGTNFLRLGMLSTGITTWNTKWQGFSAYQIGNAIGSQPGHLFMLQPSATEGFRFAVDGISSANVALSIDMDKNVGIGTDTFGTSAANVFSIATGTAPTTEITNTVRMYTTTGLDLIIRDEAGTTVDLFGLGGGPSFGTDNQIPYTNAGGTDFDYSSNLTYDGSDMAVGAAILSGTRLLVRGAGTGNTNAFLVENSAGTDRLIVWNSGEVGIGVAPAANTTLLVRGNNFTAATDALRVQNSSGANLLTVQNDSAVIINANTPAAGAILYVVGQSNFGSTASGGIQAATVSNSDYFRVHHADNRAWFRDNLSIGVTTDLGAVLNVKQTTGSNIMYVNRLSDNATVMRIDSAGLIGFSDDAPNNPDANTVVTITANDATERAHLLFKPVAAAFASLIATPTDGMLVYVNTTDGTFTSVGFWGYENGSWTKL